MGEIPNQRGWKRPLAALIFSKFLPLFHRGSWSVGGVHYVSTLSFGGVEVKQRLVFIAGTMDE
jgi:hypothetical protein